MNFELALKHLKTGGAIKEKATKEEPEFARIKYMLNGNGRAPGIAMYKNNVLFRDDIHFSSEQVLSNNWEMTSNNLK